MKTQTFPNEVIWIIGASSGIGRALAIKLAQSGATLILSARRNDVLEEINVSLGGQHQVHAFDIADSEQTLMASQRIFAHLGRIDRIIFMSAVYTPMRLDELDLLETKRSIDTNLMGAFNLIHAVLPALKQQTLAQLVLCASVAGYVGLPQGQPYSASKAALINLAESLRAECPAHLDIKMISPGFVATPLTQKNNFRMPMIISVDAAAEAIIKDLKRPVFEIHFPKRFTLVMKALRLLPYKIYFALVRVK